MFRVNIVAGVIIVTVAEALKRFRTERGLSQADVAEKLGIFPQSYYRYESGKYLPALPIIIKMADVFDVSTDYLLGRRDTPKPSEVGAEEVQKAQEFKRALKKFVEETGT